MEIGKIEMTTAMSFQVCCKVGRIATGRKVDLGYRVQERSRGARTSVRSNAQMPTAQENPSPNQFSTLLRTEVRAPAPFLDARLGLSARAGSRIVEIESHLFDKMPS